MSQNTHYRWTIIGPNSTEFTSEHVIGGFTSTTFRYEEAKFHREGKAFLGFKIIKSTNNATGFRTESENEFHPTYHVTLPNKVSKYLYATNTLLNQVTNTNEIVTYTSTKRFWSRVNSIYENSAFEGQFVSSTFTYDVHGNTINATVNTNNVETKVIAIYQEFLICRQNSRTKGSCCENVNRLSAHYANCLTKTLSYPPGFKYDSANCYSGVHFPPGYNGFVFSNAFYVKF